MMKCVRHAAFVLTLFQLCFGVANGVTRHTPKKLPDWLLEAGDNYLPECNYTFKFFANTHARTEGNAGWTYFRILDTHYLAYAANAHAAYGQKVLSKSVIYQVTESAKGKIELASVFEVDTLGARAWIHFEMLDRHMLALTHYNEDKVEIYRHNEKYFKLFEKFQTISAKGPVKVDYLEAARERYLAVAETTANQVSVYKMDGKNKVFSRFQLDQQLEVYGVTDVNFFQHDKFYLFTTSYNQREYLTKSSAYVLDYQKQLQFFQSFQTTAPNHVEAFVWKDKAFAFISSERDETHIHVDSGLYLYNDKKGKFLLHQSFPTEGARAAKYFQAAQSHWLVVANHGDKHRKQFKAESVLYKWDDKANKFVEHQAFMTFGATGFEYFRIGRNHFIAVSNEGDLSDKARHHRGIRYQDSIIYKLKTTEFCPKEEL